MSQMTLGQRAFSQYPLAQVSGTRDYVFYFVGPSDPYGEHARHFIRQPYSNHHAVDVGSFEALFAHFKNDIVQNNLAHVRAIIIVAHATAEGLITAPSAAVDFPSSPAKAGFSPITPQSITAVRAGDLY